MDTKDFWYSLPENLIAQDPIYPRDNSRLLILDKNGGKTKHVVFNDIIDYLNPGDCLVLNNTKVIPARLYGVKKQTNSFIEFLLLNRKSKDTWEVILRPGKKAKIGTEFVFGENELNAKIIDIIDGGNRIVEFQYEGLFENVLDRLGEIPLPPYIKKELKDTQRYQTVYAKFDGSAAAPTAGLHFTEELLKKISKKGINAAYITLHIGLGTFRPVKTADIESHKMHSEYYEISRDCAELINNTKAAGGRIICVGTTSVRTLESAVSDKDIVEERKGWTDIFIYPGYKFKITDGLLTNFHLPESTLLMLVCALAGKDSVMKAYEEAISLKYRFFSFGDAMLII